MIRKTFYISTNKKILKYLLLIISLLLVGSLFLLNTYKNINPSKPKKKDNAKEIKKLIDQGDIYFDSGKQNSAIVTFNKAVKLCNPKINTIDYVYALTCIMELQYQKGDYVSSEATAKETLPYLKFIKNQRYTWNVYNLQGLNYYHMWDFNNASLYFKKALKLKTIPWRKYVAINNLLLMYMQENKYQEAIAIYEILVSHKHISKHTNINKNIYSHFLSNLGFCYYQIKNYKKALYYYYKSSKNMSTPGTYEGMIPNYINLSNFFKEKNPNLAKIYALKALKSATENNFAITRIDCLGSLIKCSEGYDLKKYSQKYVQLTDSLIVANNKAEDQSSIIKYEYTLDKEENLQLKSQKTENELQIERQKNRNLILTVIIVFAVGLIIFLYSYLTSKSRKEKQQAIYKSEMRISKKLHDELANDVFQTLTFAQNRELELTENKEQLLNNLQLIYSRTRNISKENSTIPTDENFVTALKEMISEFKTQNINLLLNGIETISWNEIEKNKKITVYRVLQELLVNMKKHSNATLVGITFKTTDKNLVATYNDNGKGININDLSFKNGLYNVENRILAIKGKIDIDSAIGKGFKVFFEFPI